VHRSLVHEAVTARGFGTAHVDRRGQGAVPPVGSRSGLATWPRRVRAPRTRTAPPAPVQYKLFFLNDPYSTNSRQLLFACRSPPVATVPCAPVKKSDACATLTDSTVDTRHHLTSPRTARRARPRATDASARPAVNRSEAVRVTRTGRARSTGPAPVPINSRASRPPTLASS
jgi:hypothetical protein